MKAPIKMLFPTVLFIFPSMFIVTIGPAFLSLTGPLQQQLAVGETARPPRAPAAPLARPARPELSRRAPAPRAVGSRVVFVAGFTRDRRLRGWGQGTQC